MAVLACSPLPRGIELFARGTEANPGTLSTVPERQVPRTDPRAFRVPPLYDRFRREIHELGRFGVVGIVAWIVDTVAFNAFLSTFKGDWVGAAIASTCVSATVAFIGNRFWTWRDRPRSSLRREYILYAVFNALGLAISLLCLWISHSLLGAWRPDVFHTRLADNVAKQGFGLILGTAFRFWGYRRYVFTSLAAPDPVTAATE
jgi:putative flippase GtrA